MSEIIENGPWKVNRDARGTYVESGDFTHDVRLYVNGDFRDLEQRVAYAEEIAKRLNKYSPPRKYANVCTRTKQGEYDRLKCCRQEGHDGNCNWVVAR